MVIGVTNIILSSINNLNTMKQRLLSYLLFSIVIFRGVKPKLWRRNVNFEAKYLFK